MNHKIIYIFVMLLAGSLFALTLSTKRHRSVHVAMDSAATNRNSVIQDAQEIQQLRAQSEQIAWQQRPTEDVLAQVNATLLKAGIPSTQLRGVGNESNTTLPNQNTNQANQLLRRQSLSISIDSITLLQLGLFLDHWQQTQNLWTVRQIEITHKLQTTKTDQYNVRLQVSAIYISSV